MGWSVAGRCCATRRRPYRVARACNVTTSIPVPRSSEATFDIAPGKRRSRPDHRPWHQGQCAWMDGDLTRRNAVQGRVSKKPTFMPREKTHWLGAARCWICMRLGCCPQPALIREAARNEHGSPATPVGPVFQRARSAIRGRAERSAGERPLSVPSIGGCGPDFISSTSSCR